MAASPQEQRNECPELSIQLLGAFCVHVGSRVIDGSAWRLRKAAAIVKLLALAPHHQLYREQIMDLLWPDSAPKAAANSLRRTLYTARHILSSTKEPRSHYLQGDPLALCPDAPVWVDVGAFETAAAAARRSQDPSAYRAAIDLYTGDLLPEDRYEDWAANRREDLRRAYLSLLTDLARLYEETGESGLGIEALERVIAKEPAHEDAHVGLMRLYARSGQRYQALQQYRRLQEALDRELDAEPDPATKRVYQDMLDRHSPISSSHIRRHNLPAPLTTFVGRDREIGEVTRLLAQVRLLTLTGSGGCGKTRLAIEVASRLVTEYPDGVWLVELAALANPGLVPQAVASALSIPEQPNRPLVQTLANALEPRHLLLILDNCEHLIDACASIVDTLLRACPHLRVLVTSRQALGIAGEQVWRVPSLALPDPRRLPPLDKVSQSEAVRLFLDRARLSRPGFDLTEENVGAIVEVCKRLDGMPLAIELAAARLRVLSVEQISVLLDDRFRLLTGGSRAALPRQRTLRATVDWSYDLLGEAEKTLFDRLSVFAGGWTLEAAEAVCTGSGVASDQLLDLMAGLVDQSLVLAEAGEGSTVRYRLLETLRQYGQERLAARGETEPVRCQHAAYYLALAEAAEPEVTGPQQVAWLDRLEREHNNLRAALRGTLDGGKLEMAARLCGSLGFFWFIRGHLREGTAWLDAVLPTAGSLPEPVRAKVLTWAGALRFLQRDYDRAQAELEESLGLWQALDDRYWMAIVLNILGSSFLAQDDLQQAASLYRAALAAAWDAGDKGLIGLSLYNLGKLALNQGDYERTTALSEESLALFREVGDLRRVTLSLMNLARVAVHRTDLERAFGLYQEELEIAQAVGAKNRIAEGLEGVASIACAQGQPVRAARLLGAAQAVRSDIGVPVSTDYRAVYEHSLKTVRDALDEETFAAAWAEGRALVPEQAIQYALAEQTPLHGVAMPGESPVNEQELPLTPRETQVAVLVARGLTNREIAAELVIAEGTAANHVGHILAKLGVHSRWQIAAWAMEHGLHIE